MIPESATLAYKNPPFATLLPISYRYTRSHLWAAQLPGRGWRFGFTQFATRMLGEIVDFNFEAPAGAAVHPGQVLGWMEGFKGISDLICAAAGVFRGGNAALSADPELVTRRPYSEGWLYEIDGELEPESFDVHAYARHLEATIQKLRARPAAPPE